MLKLVARPLLCGMTLILVASCGSKKGTATNSFLQQLQGCVAQSSDALAKLPHPVAPVPPEFIAADRGKRQLPKLLEFHNQQIAYLKSVATLAEQASAVFGKSETLIGGLNVAGVEPSAIQYATAVTRSLGAGKQTCNEVAGYAQDKIVVMTHDAKSTVGMKVLASIGAALMAENPLPLLKGGAAIADDAQEKAAEVTEENSQERRLIAAVSESKREVTSALSKRTELALTMKAKYPELDWNFLTPKGRLR